MQHIQPQTSSFKAVFGSPVLVNNSLQQKQHLVLNDPSLHVHLHCGVAGCIFQTTWEFVAFKQISALDAESKKINNKAVRNIKEHMRATHSGDTCAGGYIIDAPQCRGAKDRNDTSSTIVSTLHTSTASIAAKRKRKDDDIDSEWSSETPVSKRSLPNSEARSVTLTGGSDSSAPAVVIASQREHAHAADVEPTAALEDELEDADSNSACSESQVDFESESESEKDTRLITDSERRDALTALECKYRACQEQHALRETARKNFALDAANAGVEWTHTVPWCSRSCCNKYKGSYVGDDAKLKMVATNSCSARDVDLESLAAAILCPYSMLAGLTWEVKRTSGVDEIREPMTYDESDRCMDTDLADEDYHSMLLMAKPLISAFEALCEVLGDRCGQSVDSEKPYNGAVDLYQPKPDMAQLAQRLEDAVTQQLLTRWQSQEQSDAAVSTLMSIIVAVYSIYPEQFVSNKFKESSKTFQAVAQVLCGALQRAMACQLGDGQWFSCSSPQLLTLAIRAILPRELYLHETSPEESDLTPVLPGQPGDKTRAPPASSYSDVSLTNSRSSMGRRAIVSLATISTLSVRSTMLPLLLEAPSSFWSDYISKDVAVRLTRGLMDYSLLAIGERLIMCQSSGAQIQLSYQEQHSVEMTARLVSAICSALSKDLVRWVAYIDDTHLQAFSKLAACVPGVRAAWRQLQNDRLS